MVPRHVDTAEGEGERRAGTAGTAGKKLAASVSRSQSEQNNVAGVLQTTCSIWGLNIIE